MRNLKRALSLALASVMLLGMMVIGTSAASNFTDADEIVNTEAATIVEGLGIIAGADGKFMPEQPVTRAEMAAIIVKMLYGSSFNANPFKGTTKFSDVADYQGGWAEGYINLCSSQKIFGGYGDGTFKPGQTVTTAEAASMLLSVLGLNKNLGEWPLGVITKATDIKLFGSLKLGTNDPLTRDNLSVLIVNALNYGEKEVVNSTKYVVIGLSTGFASAGTAVNGKSYDSFTAALTAAQGITVSSNPAVYNTDFTVTAVTVTEEVTKDSLGYNTFALKKASNQQVTSIELDTTTTSKTYNKLIATAGTYTYVVDNYDSIGSIVDVYYKDNSSKTVYTTVEKSTSVDVYGMTAAQWKAAFPYAKYATVSSTDLGFAAAPQYINAKRGTSTAASTAVTAPTGSNVFTDASRLIFQTSNGKKVLKAVIVDNYTVEKVVVSKNTDGTIKATINTGSVEVYNAKLNAQGKITTDKDVSNIDWASYYNVDSNKSFGYFNTKLVDGLYTFEEVKTVSGAITKLGTSNSTITLNGEKEYKASVGARVTNHTSLGVATGFTGTYTLYLDSYGNFFASVKDQATAAASDVYYVTATFNRTEATDYGSVTKTYAQAVAMDGTISTILIGVGAGDTYNKATGVNTLSAGLYTFATDVTDDSKSATLGFKKATQVTKALTEINNTNVFQGADSFKANTEFKSTTSKIEADKITTLSTGAVRLTSSTKYLFVSGSLATAKTQVVTGGINFKPTAASQFLAHKDADGNYIVDVVIIKQAYTDAGVTSKDLIYVAAGTTSSATVPYKTSAGTTGTAHVYSVYNAATGEKITINATNASLTEGFHTFKIVDGVYVVDSGAGSATVAIGVTYSSKYGTKLTANATLVDAETSGAVIVDLRTAAQKTASGVSTITSIDDMAYWTNQSKTITFTALYTTKDNAQTVSIIFVTGPTAA